VEIIDLFKLARSRVVILVLLPTLAAVVAAGYVLFKPSQYFVNATVTAPALIGGSKGDNYSGSEGAKLFAENFLAAAKSPLIARQVAAQTHVSPGSVTANTNVVQVVGSSIVQVSYAATSPKQSAAVSKAIATDTLRFLFSTQLQVAKDYLARLQAQLNAAQQAIANFAATNGPAPGTTYQALQSQINQLKVTEAKDEAAGDAAGAAVIAATITVKEIELDQFGQSMPTFNNLIAQQQSAQGAIALAQQKVNQASAQYSAADPTRTITLGQVHSVSIKTTFVKAVGYAGGGGLMVATLIVFVMELLTAARRRPDRSAGALGGLPAAG
jgi:capsular polysaccharide biosynthesis protein